MKPFEFESLTILVPNLWDKPWDDLIADEQEETERRLLAAQARYARMLKRIAPEPATPTKIAWLALWSRLFGCLVGGRGSAIWESRFAESVMARVAFETTLHLQAIMTPVLDAAGEREGTLAKQHWEQVRDRLIAYLAWALRGDERLLRHVSDERRLDETFDPRPERDFIATLGQFKEAWERLSGQSLEVVSDQEAFHDRNRARQFFREELGRIAKWQTDPRLQPWRHRLHALEQQQLDAVTLFQLLDVGKSVSGFLRSRGIGLGYYEYLQGSAFVHGSSLSASMLLTDSIVAPDFSKLGTGFRGAVDRLLSHCQLHAVLLDLLAMHLEFPPATA